MSFIKINLSILLPIVLLMSGCKLPVDMGTPVAPEEESAASVTINDVSSETDIIASDIGTASLDTNDILIETTDQSMQNDALTGNELVTGDNNAVTSEDLATDVGSQETDSKSTIVAEWNVPVTDTLEADIVLKEIELPKNTLPIATSDALTTKEDTALRGIDLLVNDSDADGDFLQVISFSQGANGGYVEQSADGTFVYTPAIDFHGNDEFNYMISDGKGGEASAVASVHVVSVNDIALTNEELFVQEDESLKNINVLANDIDKDGGSLEVLAHTQSIKGGAVKTNSDGTLDYMPAANFHGKDEFFYVVTDGQGGKEMGIVTVWVESVNDIPMAGSDSFITKQSQGYEMLLLDNDKGLGDGAELVLVSNPENGTLTLTEHGSAYYEPITGYFGSDGFVYKLVDSNGDESIATVSIQVECITDCNRTFVLSWNPSESAGVVGYKIYVGNTSEDYTEILEVGDVSKYEYFTETKGTYYFAVSAVNVEDIESSLTEEVSGTF